MHRVLLVILLVCVCIFPRMEHFTSDYNENPASVYGQAKYASGFKQVEFNERFFTDTLTKYTNNTSTPLCTEKLKKYPQNILAPVNRYVSNILNRNLPRSDGTLFTCVKSDVLEVHKCIDGYKIKSKHLVHRPKKIYGAAIELVCLVQQNTVTILSHKLLGFVFEDRIDTWSSNIDTIPKRDPQYEKSFLCAYYDKLRKERGINSKNAC